MWSAVPQARLFRSLPGLRVWEKAPLAPFTTIATGGSAGLLLSVLTCEGLVSALRVLRESEVPWFCLGGGSNLLVADRGYPGVVLKLDEGFQYVEGLPGCAEGPAERGGQEQQSGQTAEGTTRPTTLVAGAGAFLARLAAVVAEAGLSGLEWACGIPGTLGGAVVMNAGAHGVSLAQIIAAVELTSDEGARWVPREAIDCGYRYCALPSGSVVTSVRLPLTPGVPEEILQRHRALLRARRTTQPRGARTFGSAFKNPAGDSAGRLLDEAGLKGVRRGGAEVSTVHANFIVNLGDATTGDVLGLMSLMRETVQRSSGVSLDPEVKLLGAAFPWSEGRGGDG
jgi:UDP-N-acetylmuramate dehydrogenase